MGRYSRRLSRTQRRWSTRHQIDMAWLAAPGRPQRDVAIHGDDLCATSVITPCVQSANLRGTHSFARRGTPSARCSVHPHSSNTKTPHYPKLLDNLGTLPHDTSTISAQSGHGRNLSEQTSPSLRR